MTTIEKARVLLVEDTASLSRVYLSYLRNDPYDVVAVETGARALEELEESVPDAILLDLRLPDMDGFEILRHIASHELAVASVVITAHGSISNAVEAMRLGAGDFLVKPFDAARLRITLANVLERRKLSRIVETYKNDFDRKTFCGFIGGSLPMQGVYRMIESAAPSKATVFIAGESGTGKEVCAEAIHNLGPRKNSRFVAINCGAIPKDLMESEIFGHVKGAFTGALGDRDGAATQADGGTLFLDEICEMDLSLQTKLLRFIQTGSFQRVGAAKPETVDVRFICATNKDPLEEVRGGRFREDLYYRLHVVPIILPPLREREDDVLLIARQFLIDFAREEGKRFQRFTQDAETALARHDWPGNVRELQNVIRNAIVLNDGDVLMASMLPQPLRNLVGETANGGRQDPLSVPVDARLDVDEDMAASGDLASAIRPLSDVEREAIERAIALCDGNIPKAAHFLGVSSSTIYRKKAIWDQNAKKAAGE